MQWSHRRTTERDAADLTHGSPKNGSELMKPYGCIACHAVPGRSGTQPRVGPPLKGFGSRMFVAGAAENTPENVVRFIMDPRSVAPKSAMPKLDVSEPDARDLAAFLYTLQ
jgi:cytochrome c2